MSHLTLETLARLVDEPADREERVHLDRCELCRLELAALLEQRDALAALPALSPAPDAWRALRRRLVEEGLIRRPRLVYPGLARAAAAAFLFLAGSALGWGLRGPAPSSVPAPPALAVTTAAAAEEDVARGVEEASEAFLVALDRYMSASGNPASDPAARLAALDNIVLTTAEALHESPSDPIISSYHLTALAQREAVLRQLAVSAGRPVF